MDGNNFLVSLSNFWFSISRFRKESVVNRLSKTSLLPDDASDWPDRR